MILGVSVKSADLTLNAPVYTRRNLKKRGPGTAYFFVNKRDLRHHQVLTVINKSVIARYVFNSYPSKHNRCRSWVFLSISMRHCPILVGH